MTDLIVIDILIVVNVEQDANCTRKWVNAEQVQLYQCFISSFVCVIVTRTNTDLVTRQFN